MARKIKFRGYSKKFERMFTSEEFKGGSDGMVKVCNAYFEQHNIDTIPVERGLFIPIYDNDMELMQYTGLKDKNGIEIYEGDIILWVTKHRGQIIRAIEYKYGCFGVHGFLECTHITFANILDHEIEVIGNIYENSELVDIR